MARMKFLFATPTDCIGLQRLRHACKNENEVPWGITAVESSPSNDGKPGERSVSMAWHALHPTRRARRCAR